MTLSKTKNNKYQCAMCNGVFEKGWSDEEAEKECVENFGTMMAHDDDRAIVCDDCYQKIVPREHPEKMTKEEAWKIIESCKDWNVEQKSISLAFSGKRTQADDVFDARREALKLAWKIASEIVSELSDDQLNRIIETSEGIASREDIYLMAVELKKRRALSVLGEAATEYQKALEMFIEPMRRYTKHTTWLICDENLLIAAYENAKRVLDKNKAVSV